MTALPREYFIHKLYTQRLLSQRKALNSNKTEDNFFLHFGIGGQIILKKKNIVYTIILYLIILSVPIWRISYEFSKNTDNLPGLENLPNRDLGNLVGYKRSQLIAVWDIPDIPIDETHDVWELESGEELLVTYKTNGKVQKATLIKKECSAAYEFQTQ